MLACVSLTVLTVWTVAFHCYAGGVASQDSFHSAWPNKEVYFTECSGTLGSDWCVTASFAVPVCTEQRLGGRTSRRAAPDPLRWEY
jgi:hypothetical protein